MKGILIGGGIIVLIAAALLAIGLTQPKSHVARGRAVYRQSPEKVWAVLSDFERWPEWNSNFTSMDRRTDSNGQPVWSFTGKWGEMPSRIEVLQPPTRMVTHILEDANLGFSGSWEYEIAPAGDGSSLTITERGRLDSVLFRAMSIFHDNHATMRQFLTDLGTEFGEVVEMEVVR